MAPEHEDRSTLLTSRDIAALNRARAVLKRIEDAAWRRSLDHYDPFAPVTAWDLGRLSEAASTAEGALFHVLTTARANCGVRMTDTQLHGPKRGSEHGADVGETAEKAQEAPAPDPPAEDATPVAPEAPVVQVAPPRPQDVRRPSGPGVRGPIRAV